MTVAVSSKRCKLLPLPHPNAAWVPNPSSFRCYSGRLPPDPFVFRPPSAVAELQPVQPGPVADHTRCNRPFPLGRNTLLVPAGRQLNMGGMRLEIPCSKGFYGITPDPQLDWSMDDLISELNELELKQNRPLLHPMPQKETKILGFSDPKNYGAFMMHVSDDDMDNIDGGEHTDEPMTGTRFSCPELVLSDGEDFEDDLNCETVEDHLMDETGLAEGILFELERENQLRVKEEIRNKFSAWEADLRNESERSASAIVRIEKYIEARREMDKRLDRQYQRKIAEAVDSHLLVVRRQQEQKCQKEEQRIISDAAFEEAKRKEKVLQEEKARQEKAEEARLMAAKAVEEARKAALDFERKSKEASEKQEASETKKVVALDHKRYINEEVKESGRQSNQEGSNASNKIKSAGIIIKAADTALKAEMERLGKHKEVTEMNHTLKLKSSKDFNSWERRIARCVNQISGNPEKFRAKTTDLVKLINDPLCPQSISIAMFAKKVVSLCEISYVSMNATAFACGRVIVLVSSQAPTTMDLVLAEFHKACIYTVPKHIDFSEEEDGKIESTARYLERVETCMTLYAAMVQTEIDGFRNPHGIQEGWAWFARFLNHLPANAATGVALLAFLRMAGFMLFRKYKSQFKKILDVIYIEFLVELKRTQDPKLNQVIIAIEAYIETEQFLQEPQGWRLQSSNAFRT